MNNKRIVAFSVVSSDFVRIDAMAKREYGTVASFCRRAVMQRVETIEAEGRRAPGRGRGGGGRGSRGPGTGAKVRIRVEDCVKGGLADE
jgi:hypothetical protein